MKKSIDEFSKKASKIFNNGGLKPPFLFHTDDRYKL